MRNHELKDLMCALYGIRATLNSFCDHFLGLGAMEGRSIEDQFNALYEFVNIEQTKREPHA